MAVRVTNDAGDMSKFYQLVLHHTYVMYSKLHQCCTLVAVSATDVIHNVFKQFGSVISHGGLNHLIC